jgi:hypothetical protein
MAAEIYISVVIEENLIPKFRAISMFFENIVEQMHRLHNYIQNRKKRNITMTGNNICGARCLIVVKEKNIESVSVDRNLE